MLRWSRWTGHRVRCAGFRAAPVGIGLILHAFGVHHLQHGRDGRLGTIGVWIFALCSSAIIIQCMASLPAGAELRWGPSYPLCAVGSFIGLALLAAASWKVGLLPRWMLGIWPPLMLFGSWAGQNLIPIALAAFLVTSRNLDRGTASTPGRTEPHCRRLDASPPSRLLAS